MFLLSNRPTFGLMLKDFHSDKLFKTYQGFKISKSMIVPGIRVTIKSIKHKTSVHVQV